MRNVLVVGLGLIGASLAKNIRYTQMNCKVIGFDNDQKTMEYASKYQLIDESASSLEKGIEQADVVILATPITITIQYIKRLNEMPLNREIIVSDVSSVKGPIMKAARAITNKHLIFIGGHPMAGSHKQGVEAAKSHLFENAYYVLTPSKSAEPRHISVIKDTLSGTKCLFVELTEDDHDKMTGIVSHFPHLIASSLVHQAINWQSEYPFIPKLAAGGFRDITRIASSNPKLWQDIFFQNKGEMISFLKDWIQEMHKVKSLLEADKRDDVIHYLELAKNYRDGLPQKEKGAIPNFYDIYVDIYDRPGELYRVLKLFAEHEINIVNTQILEIRENMTGVLRLTVQNEDAQSLAKALLEEHKYEVSIEE